MNDALPAETVENGHNGKTVPKPRTSGRKKKALPRAVSSKTIPWTFPNRTLEEAIQIPKAIDEVHGGNPMAAADLAKAVGFNLANDWRFKFLLRAANQYGLVSGSGEKAVVTLVRIGEDIIAPSDPSLRKRALLEAFHNVDEFKRVDQFYGSKRLPEDEFFKNTLIREIKIPRDRVDTFAAVFRKNIAYLTSFDARPGVSMQQLEGRRDGETPASDKDSTLVEGPQVRK